MMKRGPLIIINACIWGLVILSCAWALKGTDAYPLIQTILSGGAGATLFLLLFGTRKDPKKQKER